MRKYTYEAPESWEELFTILAQTDEDTTVEFLAGGTDLIPKLNLQKEKVPENTETPKTIIYLGKLGMDMIQESNNQVVIGAACKLNDIMTHPIIQKKVPSLIETIHEMAGLTIRNIATLGGNIMNASPAADSIPTLIALDATFVLKSAAGERKIKANKFFNGFKKTVKNENEVLSAVIIDVLPGKAAFRKLGRRQAETLSVVNAAAYVETENGVCKKIRIALGSVASTVIRCRATEEILIGKHLDKEMIKEACKKVVDEISPIDDIRSSAWYRKKVAPVMAARAIWGAANGKEES